MDARKKAKNSGLKAEFIPKVPILVIEGSRLSGKSQFAFRTAISAILDGYAQSAMLCTITENGSIDSMNLLDLILEQAEEPVVKSRDRDRPMRVLSNNETIFIDFLNRTDSKARQTKADILVLEELEKWNEKDGNAALYTMIRHFDLIIVISNQLPRWARVFFNTFYAEYERIDYWENTALEPGMKESLDQKRIDDPDGWARDVMYQPTGGQDRVFTERAVSNIFNAPPSEYRPIVSILSNDCGAGGPDPSVVMRMDYDNNGVIRGHLLMEECIAPDALCQRLARYRVDEIADEEVWDSYGVGGAIMQFRAPKETWARMGIVPFIGAATDPKSYYNVRAEAYMLTADALQRNCLRITGLSVQQQEELTLEMRSTTLRTNDQARTHNTLQIAKKEDIKKRLGGLSPNKLDAIVIGVWRLLTYHKNSVKVKINGGSAPTNTTGVPTL